MNNKLILALCLASSLFISACATNPVTGQRELSLVSEKQELAIGAQQYAPMRQSQGGILFQRFAHHGNA